MDFKTKDLPTQTKNVEKSMTIADAVTNGIGNGHTVPDVSDIASEEGKWYNLIIRPFPTHDG